MQICERHGQFESTHYAYGQIDVWTSCPSCREESRLATIAEHEHREREQVKAARIAAAKIPARFHGKTIDDFEVVNLGQRHAKKLADDYVANFKENLNAGRCLVFFGPSGTGKTHLACAIVAALAEQGYATRYATVAGVIREIRATWDRSSARSETEVLNSLRRFHLLVLDEVGVQFGTEKELVQFTELIDLRYQDNRPTLLISNFSKPELDAFLGPRITDRFRENGGIGMLFDWESKRGQVTAELIASLADATQRLQ
jgi:DNA replication protein DnaC